VRSKGPQIFDPGPGLRMRRLLILCRHDYDVIEPCALLINRLVSEIFSIKVADTQTRRLTIRVA